LLLTLHHFLLCPSLWCPKLHSFLGFPFIWLCFLFELVCYGCHNDVSQTYQFRTTEIYWPTVWKLEVWDHSVGRTMLNLKTRGRICLSSLAQMTVVCSLGATALWSVSHSFCEHGHLHPALVWHICFHCICLSVNIITFLLRSQPLPLLIKT
jgi:hypothetical protein